MTVDLHPPFILRSSGSTSKSAVRGIKWNVSSSSAVGNVDLRVARSSIIPSSSRVTALFPLDFRILKDKLPPSAYGYEAWWAHEKEGNHVNLRAWSNAGWKIDSLDLKRKRVKLIRVG